MAEEIRQPRLDVGGQAVIEGVMMRGPRGYVTAVRLPSSGEIEVQEVPYRPLAKRFRPAAWPFLRGAIALVEMMIIGIKTLNWSAGSVAEDEERAKRVEKGEDPAEPPKEAGTLTRIALTTTLIVSLAFAMALFVAIPNLLTHCLSNFPEVRGVAAEVGWGQALWKLAIDPHSLGFQEYDEPLTYNLISGCVRISIFLLYIWAISLLQDIRRVFQYHGAEHMAIKTYEAGEPLEVAYAREKTTPHPRCGTTFVFVTMLIAIFVFSVLTRIMVAIWPELREINWWAFKGIMITTHILFMPLVAGVSYEIIRRGGKNPNHPLIRPVIWPGLQFQRLTTRIPDDTMLEVALVSLQRALALSDMAPAESKAALDEATGAIY